MIDTVPLPDKPVSFRIPLKYLQEFAKDDRIVVKYFLQGIPVPDDFLAKVTREPDKYKDLTKQFDIFLVPK